MLKLTVLLFNTVPTHLLQPLFSDYVKCVCWTTGFNVLDLEICKQNRLGYILQSQQNIHTNFNDILRSTSHNPTPQKWLSNNELDSN